MITTISIEQLDEDFRCWLNQRTTLDMAARIAYEFGDMVYFEPGSIEKGDGLYTILYAAFNAGVLSIQVDQLTQECP